MHDVLQDSIMNTRNTFYGTRYLSHCCVLFCIKTFFL